MSRMLAIEEYVANIDPSKNVLNIRWAISINSHGKTGIPRVEMRHTIMSNLHCKVADRPFRNAQW